MSDSSTTGNGGARRSNVFGRINKTRSRETDPYNEGIIRSVSSADSNTSTNKNRRNSNNGSRSSTPVEEMNQRLGQKLHANEKSKVGPLLFPGGSLHRALVAMEHYHSKVADLDARRWRRASASKDCEEQIPVEVSPGHQGMDGDDDDGHCNNTNGNPSFEKMGNKDGALPAIQQAAANLGERAMRREKGMMNTQLKLAEAELELKRRKEDAANLWAQVRKKEAEVKVRMEEMTRERSRLREMKRRQAQNDRQAAISSEALESTVTQQEIWELVSQVAVDMDNMSFAPTGLPEPKFAGPIDKALSPHGTRGNMVPNGGHASAAAIAGNVGGFNSLDGDGMESEIPALPIDAREDLEDALGLTDLNKAAEEADEHVKDAAGILLNILSLNDTTKRSARVAAESCLLSCANAQANCIRSLLELERASIEDRLKCIEKLEKKVNEINVRKDLDIFIEHEKTKVPHGASRTGDDDDGGIASALAVLNCHSEGVGVGVGVADTAEMSSFSGWSDGSESDAGFDREELEESVGEFFKKEERLSPEELRNTVVLLKKAASERSIRGRGYRASICYEMNNQRGKNTQLFHEDQFVGLCEVLDSLLTGCDREAADIATAKMCMMLAQTFYMTEQDSSNPADAEDRTKRLYLKTKLCNHAIWTDEDFWVQALFQCVTEALTHSGVMVRVKVKKSKSTQTRKIKWHDLSPDERAEAASQVHSVIFAQLGALAHSMIEFGCTVEEACAFVRRLSVRHQLPLSQRTILLSHLTQKSNSNPTQSEA